MAAEQQPPYDLSDDAPAVYSPSPSTARALGNLQAQNSSDSDSESKSLQFIHIKQPSDITTEENQRLVRSTAMRSVWRRERDIRTRRHDPTLPLPKLAQATMGGSGQRAVAQPRHYNVLLPQILSEGSSEEEEREENHFQTYRESRKLVGEALVRSPSQSPLSILNAGRIDPFVRYPLKHRPYVDELIDHFANVLAPSHIPTAGSSNPLVTRLVPYGRDHAVVLHALLAVSGAHLTVIQGGQVPNKREMYHRGKTFRLLNVLLSDPRQATSDMVVAAILNVSGYDVLFGLHDSHELHMEGLDSIIELRGGMKNLGLGGLLEKQMKWSNHFRALQKASLDPTTARGEYLNKSEPTFLQSNTTLTEDNKRAIIPSGFQELAQRGYIGIALTNSIQLMHSLACDLQEYSALDVLEDDISLFSDRRHTLELRLDAFRKSIRASTEGIEECMCLAALIFDHTAMRQLPLASFPLVTLSQELKLAVAQTDLEDFWGPSSEALIWVCCLASATTINLSEKYWYAELLRHIISATEPILDWAAIIQVLDKFFWSHRYKVAADEMWALVQALI